MVFYKVEAARAKSEKGEQENTRQKKQNMTIDLAEKSEKTYQKSKGQSMVITVSVRECFATFLTIAQTSDEARAQIASYMNKLPFRVESFHVEEITFASLQSFLRTADCNDYIRDADEILERFEMDNLDSRHGPNFGESMIDESLSAADCRKVASDFLFDSTMCPEIDRIENHKKKLTSKGHPVHYVIEVDDRTIRKTIYRALLSCLYNNGRIENKRYSFVDYNSESRFPGPEFEALYRSSAGGVVVIRYTDAGEASDRFARRSADVIAALCETAVKYKHEVLTVLCVPRAAEKVKEEFLLNFGNTAFIELREGVAFDTAAEAYLKSKAQARKIRSNKKLLSRIEQNKGYTAAELNRLFDEWYSEKLRCDVYPQYKTTETVKANIQKEAPRGTAYDKLGKLIGLENAKAVMNNALNYFKAQKLFADRGIVAERPSMHMVFTGNPGTAKTTVARLFAEIMKENGLLQNGDLYEVGRADLVGKYVGSTAPQVQAAFKRAKGGVLFIDEAYSLVDDRDGLFGDEAINAIVQEMENNRKDTVVVFAGYPDKMEGFLNKNPGLRSRIAFHVPFEDYSVKELCEIAKLMASEKKLQFSEKALCKLESVFTAVREHSDFGNGRFVRNVIEKAKMAQANRLMRMNLDAITDADLVTITDEDIQEPEQKNNEKVIKIGFSA